MIHGHGRNDRQGWLRDDVGGVEIAAEPDFQNDRIGLNLRECQERGGRRHLEECDGIAGVRALHALEQGCQMILRDRSCNTIGAGNRDPLVETNQMR